jgi:hypothetical protein
MKEQIHDALQFPVLQVSLSLHAAAEAALVHLRLEALLD